MTIPDLIRESHETAKEKGWWAEPREIGTQLMLMVTELAEAMEIARVGGDDWISTVSVGPAGKPEGFPIELADVLIRLADTCGYYGIDLEEAVRLKLAYNKTRSYRHGGKKA